MNDSAMEYRHSPAVTIRWATPADADALADLAELDEAAIPEAPVLLAFVDDELWVAKSLSTSQAVSDPFKRTADVVALVDERALQLTVPDRSRFDFAGARRRWFAAKRLRARAQPRW